MKRNDETDKQCVWLIVKEGGVVSDLKRFDYSKKSQLENKDEDKELFVQNLQQQLGFSEDVKNKVLKLRNGRGSLVPLSRSMPTNTITSPYSLEVCEKFSSVKPDQKQIKIPTYSETVNRKIENFTKRLEKLEGTVPDLPDRRKAKLDAEMRDLERRLNFLDSKLKEAESHRWKGMFKKQPLW